VLVGVARNAGEQVTGVASPTWPDLFAARDRDHRGLVSSTLLGRLVTTDHVQGAAAANYRAADRCGGRVAANLRGVTRGKQKYDCARQSEQRLMRGKVTDAARSRGPVGLQAVRGFFSRSLASSPRRSMVVSTRGHSCSRKRARSSFMSLLRAPVVTNMPRPRFFSTRPSSTSC